MVTRPPRTEAHRQRDTYLQQFADLGLTPVVSTNGAIPNADIQSVKGTKPGDVPECWVTEQGRERLRKAGHTHDYRTDDPRARWNPQTNDYSGVCLGCGQIQPLREAC